MGESIYLNAAINDGLPNIGFNDGVSGGGENGFNDQTSSIRIIKGEWVFHTEENFSSNPDTEAIFLGPGTYNVSAAINDRITSAFRVG